MTNEQIEQKLSDKMEQVKAGSAVLSEDELGKAAGGWMKDRIDVDPVTPPPHYDQSKDNDPAVIPLPPGVKPI